jgi:hypothetical protein
VRKKERKKESVGKEPMELQIQEKELLMKQDLSSAQRMTRLR